MFPSVPLLLLLLAAAAALRLSRAAAGSAAFSANLLHSNAIKSLPPGGAVAAASSSSSSSLGGPAAGHSARPDVASNNNHPVVETHQQPPACGGDDDCKPDEFCSASGRGQVCLACRRRRKRCLRDGMCCPGSRCSNGMCMPSEHDHFHPGDIEETVVLENFDHGTLYPHPKRTTSSSQLHYLKGQEGSVCLRSSDCAAGLCCARHFWSKICKPVLQEGQVCTKHRKKGSHGLEIFQRCYCADGLACRLQRDHGVSNTARLHTCQRH